MRRYVYRAHVYMCVMLQNKIIFSISFIFKNNETYILTYLVYTRIYYIAHEKIEKL